MYYNNETYFATPFYKRDCFHMYNNGKHFTTITYYANYMLRELHVTRITCYANYMLRELILIFRLY
jgi:hypothetical protein